MQYARQNDVELPDGAGAVQIIGDICGNIHYEEKRGTVNSTKQEKEKRK